MKTIEQLEQDLQAVTSRLTLLDEIVKANKLGRNVTLGFQCGHSGLWFPSDYVKEWGRLYGIGLGPDPVSEVLDSEYEIAPPAITPETRRIEQIMHPLRTTRSQVDMNLVDLDQADLAILGKDDPYMDRRAEICYARQLVNPASKLALVRTAWAMQKQGAFK